MKIQNIIGREILDSRGNPTIEVDVILECGVVGRASVPSGASTGKREALELRDNDNNRYLGKGVLKAVNNVNEIIRPNLIGFDVSNQKEIDEKLISLDNTENKSNLGANAILGVSLAALKARSLCEKKEIYELIGSGTSLPKPMMNILNGGAHATNNLCVQEFMIVPNRNTFRENLQIGAEVFHHLKLILKNKNQSTGVGDEGGFAPNLENTYEALSLIREAITNAGYKEGADVNMALDVAASEFYQDGLYKFEGKNLTSEDMVNYYEQLINDFPVISIEDGLAEDDYDGWAMLTSKLGKKINLVGDDLFVTNKKLLQYGIDNKIANSILIKLNQIGTVTETLETIELAKQNNYKTIISHRSGETEDTTIADIAVGLDLGRIKTGSISRGERICKYNRLLRIEEKINNK